MQFNPPNTLRILCTMKINVVEVRVSNILKKKLLLLFLLFLLSGKITILATTFTNYLTLI